MYYNAHGGSCCGYAHLYDMDHGTIVSLDERLATHFREGNSNRVLEVILSERQVTATRVQSARTDNRWSESVREAGGWPAVLASRGFRLSARWRNSNSGQICYQFLKTTEFLPLTNLPFDWEAARTAAPLLGAAPLPHPNAGDILTDRIALTLEPGTMIENINLPGTGARPFVSYSNNGGYIRIRTNRGTTAGWVLGNCRIARQQPVVVPPAPPPAPVPVLTVFSTYHNAYNNGERRGAGYDTYAQARQAAPRCRRVDRRDIRSTGQIQWVESVTE